LTTEAAVLALGIDSRGVDEGLEGRTGLAVSALAAIEAAQPVAVPAHQG